MLTDPGIACALKLCSPADLAADRPGHAEFADSRRAKAVPDWDAVRRRLCFKGEIVKAFRVPAPNQEAVLNAFEQAQWPACIDNPLDHCDHAGAHQLQQTIRALNRARARAVLRFRGDGTGTRVCWDVICGRS
jgi:hypothetical protein